MTTITLIGADAARARNFCVRVRERRAAAAPARSGADDARRDLVLRLVQPALVGLTDGSVSTLAPIFATALATGDDWKTFLVGMASSVGAGISMGFAEATSDDGALSGRGPALVRGLACGLATALGGVGHTLPFLLPDLRTALAASLLVVLVELWLIAWVRARFMGAPMGRALVQVVVGGLVVLGVGAALGAA